MVARAGDIYAGNSAPPHTSEIASNISTELAELLRYESDAAIGGESKKDPPEPSLDGGAHFILAWTP